MKVMVEVISPEPEVTKAVLQHLAGCVILRDGAHTKVIKSRQGNGLTLSRPHRAKKGKGSFQRKPKHKFRLDS